MNNRGESMAKAIDAADYIIQAAKHDGVNNMTNMKLNKVLYYAQAISLQKYGHPLFEDPINAWTLGPVVPHVYYAFNEGGERGDKPITAPQQKVPDNAFTPDEADALSDAYVAFGRTYDAEDLSHRTHKDGGPWSQCYKPGMVPGVEIPIDLIKQYFSEHPVVKENAFDSEGEILIAPDSNGRLDIPEDWD